MELAADKNTSTSSSSESKSENIQLEANGIAEDGEPPIDNRPFEIGV